MQRTPLVFVLFFNRYDNLFACLFMHWLSCLLLPISQSSSSFSFLSEGKDKHYLYNHVRIIIAFNEDHNPDLAKRKFEGSRVTGFRVEPFSIRHKWNDRNGEGIEKVRGEERGEEVNGKEGNTRMKPNET